VNGTNYTSTDSGITYVCVNGKPQEKGYTPAAPAPSAPTGTIPGEGTFLVGTDIAPGTYRSGPSRDVPCQWWTQSQLGNDNSQTGFDSSNGQTYATIRPTDASFHTQFCQTWIKVR
jgi:hypothetical protein